VHFYHIKNVKSYVEDVRKDGENGVEERRGVGCWGVGVLGVDALL
jgi:hypothetical protein